MRKLALFFISISFFSISNAQITKRNWMLGGVINYSRIDRNSEVYGPHQVGYVLNIRPNIGYFPADKFAIGVKADIGKEGYKAPNTSGYNKYTNFNIGPYLRYYFLDTDNSVNILSEGTYQYGFERGTQDDGTAKNTFVFSAGPVVYFNTVVGLEFLVSYSTSKFSGFKGSNNVISMGLGLQVHLEKEK